MDNRTRFLETLRFNSVDRLPMIEWATWWDKTIERWKQEGLPSDLQDNVEIMEYFGLDPICQWWFLPQKPSYGEAIREQGGKIQSMDDYLALKEHLFPENPIDCIPKSPRDFPDSAAQWATRQAKGEVVLWISLHGFFWFPRELFGIEEHLYSFFDHPEIMHQMNQDLVDYNLKVLDAFCEICIPDFMTFGEDMSYNLGPMISEDLFNTFMAPYYKQIVPRILEYGIVPFVDSDGDVEKLIPWFTEVGVEGFLPLEKQAGVDIALFRKKYPSIKMIGGYDKMVMNKGESAIRSEFERILPIMKSGGYIPSVDHQTPPGVSLDDYRLYLSLLKQYSYA